MMQTNNRVLLPGERRCSMEFITDISFIINEAEYKQPGPLMNILQSFRHEKKGPCYTVRGTYEELEKLSVKLSAVSHASTHGGTTHQEEQALTRVKSVDVSGIVMAYIQQKWDKDLHKIGGNSFVIKTQPDLRKAHSGTVRVTFRPRHGSMDPVHADFVRQRFITFYQRTASDLQSTSVPLSAHEQEDLQRRFPHILFTTSNSKAVSVCGPFGHIAKLKEFLSQNMPSATNKSAAYTPSSGTLDPLPAHSTEPEDVSCPICMEPIAHTERETLKCKHSFCRNCLKKSFKYKPVCPTCGHVYGVLTGTQPHGGKMKVTKKDSSLPGYEKYGTIIIHYYIPSGTQQEEHPHPGQPYEGASRTAYLPDCLQGRRTLTLLTQAFNQRLIFTVGRSTTSGMNNMVTWNDIHHKTSTHGGPTHYGYPDPDYLSRVQDELKVKGIE